MQPSFLTAIPENHRVHWRCSFALEAAAGLGLPVLFTEQVPAKLGGTAADLLALCAQPEVLGKSAFSAFGDEAIVARLRARQVKHLLLCGIETPVCVYQTARDALQAGYQVTILTDVVAGRRAADGAAALAHLAQLGCTLLPAETIFYSLLLNARHPFFRDYTALVKKYG
jgi:nicotinamidase-related amidase